MAAGKRCPALPVCSFPLARLVPEERSARARCLALQGSRVKAWTCGGAALLAAAPDASASKQLKHLARGGIPPSLRPALWPRLSGGAAMRAAAPAQHYAGLAAAAERPAGAGGRFQRCPSLSLYNAFPSHPLLSSLKGLQATRRLVGALAAQARIPAPCAGLIR